MLHCVCAKACANPPVLFLPLQKKLFILRQNYHNCKREILLILFEQHTALQGNHNKRSRSMEDFTHLIFAVVNKNLQFCYSNYIYYVYTDIDWMFSLLLLLYISDHISFRTQTFSKFLILWVFFSGGWGLFTFLVAVNQTTSCTLQYTWLIVISFDSGMLQLDRMFQTSETQTTKRTNRRIAHTEKKKNWK